MGWHVVLVAFALAAFIAVAYRRRWRWTGLTEVRRAAYVNEHVEPAKTLWDWLQLALVPVALAALAFLLNSSATERDQRREDLRSDRQAAIAADARREGILRAYLAQMSGLVLNHALLRARSDADVYKVARTLTFTAVRRLDDEQQGVVVRFLTDAHLLDLKAAKVSLRQAVLSGADLQGANLRRVNLRGADLRGANLRDADLYGADLTTAILADADLSNADLRFADLQFADLRGSDRRGTALRGAVLRGARLK